MRTFHADRRRNSNSLRVSSPGFLILIFYFFFWLWVGLALSEEIFSSGRSRNIIAWITALISQKTWQRMWLLVCAVDSSSLPNPQSFTFCFALAFHGLCHRYRSDSNRSSGPCSSRIFGPGCANVFFFILFILSFFFAINGFRRSVQFLAHAAYAYTCGAPFKVVPGAGAPPI